MNTETMPDGALYVVMHYEYLFSSTSVSSPTIVVVTPDVSLARREAERKREAVLRQPPRRSYPGRRMSSSGWVLIAEAVTRSGVWIDALWGVLIPPLAFGQSRRDTLDPADAYDHYVVIQKHPLLVE